MQAVDGLRYQKKVNKPVQGYEFEEKLTAFIILAAFMRGEPFRVAVNLKCASKLDDIVVSYGEGEQRRTYTLQLKYKALYTVKESTLMNKKDFKMALYFDSYYEIKKSWHLEHDLQAVGSVDNVTPILYTSARFDACGIMMEAAPDCDVLPATGRIFKICKDVQKNQLRDHCRGDPDKLAIVDEFCSRFLFYAEQRCPCCLEELTITNIEECCKVSRCEAKKKFAQFMNTVTSWCRDNSGVFITNDNFKQYFPEIVIRSNPEIPNPDHLNSYGFINFNLADMVTFKQELACGILKVMHLVARNGTSSLVCLKVKQAFDNAIVLHVRTAVRIKEEVLRVWPSKCCRVLALECAPQNSADFADIHSIISSSMSTEEQWQVILITNDGSFDEVSLSKLSDVRKSVTCEFSQLTPESKEVVMCKEIVFQGRLVTIGSLLPAATMTKGKTGRCLLSRLLDNQNCLKVGRQIFQLTPHYISRTVKIYDSLKLDIFWTRDSILLAISGVSAGDLKKQLRQHASRNGFHFSGKSGSMSNVNVRQRNGMCEYVVIQSPEEFGDLCERHDNVHWLHMTDTTLYWRQSRGDQAVIRAHMDHSGRLCSQEDIYQVPDGLVSIVAESDMGKTTLLNCLALSMTQGKEPPLWVVFVSVDSVRQWMSADTAGHDSVVEVLAENAVEKDKIGKKIFYYFLQTSPEKVVIIIDDFQEIYPRGQHQCINFIRELQRLHLKWIITAFRPMETIDLERHVDFTKVCLQPLDEQQRKTLISKQFQRSGLSEHDLSSINKRFVEATDEAFVGNPLHLVRALEQFYSRECLLSKRIDLLKLVRTCVKDKIMKHAGTIEKSETRQDHHLNAEEVHKRASVVSRLSEQEIRSVVGREEWSQTQSCSTPGIITDVRDGKPLYLHRIYCDYFFSCWLVEKFEVNISLLQEIILQARFLTVKAMWNRMMCQEIGLHTAVLDKDVSQLKVLLDSGANVNEKDAADRTALHLAADQSCREQVQMIRLLVKYGADVMVTDKLDKMAIDYAFQSESWEVFYILQEDTSEKSNVGPVSMILGPREDNNEHTL